jgi:hypothetical protein
MTVSAITANFLTLINLNKFELTRLDCTGTTCCVCSHTKSLTKSTWTTPSLDWVLVYTLRSDAAKYSVSMPPKQLTQSNQSSRWFIKRVWMDLRSLAAIATSALTHARATRDRLFAALDVFFKSFVERVVVTGHFGFGQGAFFPGLQGNHGDAAHQRQGQCEGRTYAQRTALPFKPVKSPKAHSPTPFASNL